MASVSADLNLAHAGRLRDVVDRSQSVDDSAGKTGHHLLKAAKLTIKGSLG
jgi:hypothetical protein